MKLQHHGTAERPFAMPLPTEPTVFTEADIRQAIGPEIVRYPEADFLIRQIVDANAQYASLGERYGASDREFIPVTGTKLFHRQTFGWLRQLGLTPVADQ